MRKCVAVVVQKITESRYFRMEIWFSKDTLGDIRRNNKDVLGDRPVVRINEFLRSNVVFNINGLCPCHSIVTAGSYRANDKIVVKTDENFSAGGLKSQSVKVISNAEPASWSAIVWRRIQAVTQQLRMMPHDRRSA